LPSSRDVVVLDFPGVQGVKRRPAVVLSSNTYHTTRPDVIVGLITSQTASALAPTDYLLEDWAAAGLRLASTFRAFIVTIPASSLIAHIGQLSDRDWEGVSSCVRAAFAPLESC
jgi:mRNA interferase MazF